jgi:hypothetical protein
LPFRQLSSVSQSVLHRAESFQSELDALVVVVAHVIMHARLQIINAMGDARRKYSAFKVPKKLSIFALSKQFTLRLMLCMTPRCESIA